MLVGASATDLHGPAPNYIPVYEGGDKLKDFDAERLQRHREREEAMGDREFVFGGQTFRYRANVQYNVLGEVSAMTADTDGNSVIRTLEHTVLDLLEGDEETRQRFLDICQNRDSEFPVTFLDLNDLATWLIQEQVQSPTGASSPSTPGDATTTTKSTGNSSSQPAAVSAA